MKQLKAEDLIRNDDDLKMSVIVKERYSETWTPVFLTLLAHKLRSTSFDVNADGKIRPGHMFLLQSFPFSVSAMFSHMH